MKKIIFLASVLASTLSFSQTNCGEWKPNAPTYTAWKAVRSPKATIAVKDTIGCAWEYEQDGRNVPCPDEADRKKYPCGCKESLVFTEIKKCEKANVILLREKKITFQFIPNK